MGGLPYLYIEALPDELTNNVTNTKSEKPQLLQTGRLRLYLRCADSHDYASWANS